MPGDLITDLFNAGQIAEPILNNNFLNSSIWNDNVWTYSVPFTVGDDVLDAMEKGTRACRWAVPAPPPCRCTPPCAASTTMGLLCCLPRFT